MNEVYPARRIYTTNTQAEIMVAPNDNGPGFATMVRVSPLGQAKAEGGETVFFKKVSDTLEAAIKDIDNLTPTVVEVILSTYIKLGFDMPEMMIEDGLTDIIGGAFAN